MIWRGALCPFVEFIVLVFSLKAGREVDFTETVIWNISGSKNVTFLVEGSVVPGSVVPGSVVPGSVVPGSVVPGSVVPGSVVPGSVVPGSVVPGSSCKCRSFKLLVEIDE